MGDQRSWSFLTFAETLGFHIEGGGQEEGRGLSEQILFTIEGRVLPFLSVSTSRDEALHRDALRLLEQSGLFPHGRFPHEDTDEETDSLEDDAEIDQSESDVSEGEL